MTDLIQTKEPTMSSLRIAEITGKPHNDVLKAIRKMEIAWYKVCKGNFSLTSRMVEMPNGGYRQENYYELTKDQTLYVATKFNDEMRAQLVIEWEKYKTESYEKHSLANNSREQIEMKMAFAAWSADFLKLNDVSKLEMAHAIGDEVGMGDCLPSYVKTQSVSFAAKTLLERYNVSMTTAQLNVKLIEAGFLETLSRPSSTKGEKTFKHVTEKGLEYGENQKCYMNPRETQPMWYEDKFPDLLNKLHIAYNGQSLF